MLGGGEHSFLELLKNIPYDYHPIAVLPSNESLAKSLEKAHIETHIIPLSNIRPWRITGVFLTAYRLFCLCQKLKVDLIYSNGSRATFYSIISKPAHRLPIVWHCRIAERDNKLDWLLGRMSDLIVTNSHATARRFKNLFRKKIKVIYNGIEVHRFREPFVEKPSFIKNEWKIILVIARISKSKRHDLALKTFERIARIYHDLHLVFIGAKDPVEPEWQSLLLERTKLSPYADRIHWIDHQNDLRPWYYHADLFFLPTEREAFGRVIIEAMACGLPVITTNVGGLREIVGHMKDGILVPPGNVKKMADAIMEILDNDNLKTKLSLTAQKRAGDFGLKSHIDNMAYIFDSVIDNVKKKKKD